MGQEQRTTPASPAAGHPEVPAEPTEAVECRDDSAGGVPWAVRAVGVLLCLALTVVLILFLLQWPRRYAGGVSGSAAIEGSFLQNCYQLGYLREGKAGRRPHIAVLWVAHMAGSGAGFESFLGHATVGIHGHTIHVSDGETAAYALRPDYTLQRLPLTEDEVVHLFKVVETEGLMLYSDSVWQEKAAPHLSVVESPEWQLMRK